MSDGLGADKRIVAMLQYSRVLLIVVCTPIVAKVAFGAVGARAPVPASSPQLQWVEACAVTAACVALGTFLGRITRLSSAALLGPMLVAAVLTVAGLRIAVAPPQSVEAVALAVIGFDVGVRFTADSLRHAARVMGVAVLHILGLLVGCALLGLVLARMLNVSALDGYLATTPGALYVVVAVAVGSGTNAAVVLSVQVTRLLLMLLVAPALARRLRPRLSEPSADASGLPPATDTLPDWPEPR